MQFENEQEVAAVDRVLVSRRALLTLPAIGGVALLAGCGIGGGDKPTSDLIAWPEKNEWPTRLQEAPQTTQENYHFAAANKETLQWFACYCGCVDTDKHASNFDCYVEEEFDDGSVLLDTHSFT